MVDLRRAGVVGRLDVVLRQRRARLRQADQADEVGPRALVADLLLVVDLPVMQVGAGNGVDEADSGLLRQAQHIVGAGRERALVGPDELRAAIVEVGVAVELLLVDDQGQVRGARRFRRRQHGAGLDPRQVVGQQQVALEVGLPQRPNRRDLRQIGPELRLGDVRAVLGLDEDLVDIAFDHLDVHDAGPDALRRHQRDRQRVARLAVFRRDRRGDVVDLRQRDVLAEELLVERREIGLAEDRRAFDDDAGEREAHVLRPARRLFRLEPRSHDRLLGRARLGQGLELPLDLAGRHRTRQLLGVRCSAEAKARHHERGGRTPEE